MGNGGLLLQDEAVAGLAGDALELDPRREEDLFRRGQNLVDVGDHVDRNGRRHQGMHVTQAAPALLQVGLEQERDVAEPAVSRGDRVPEIPQPATPVSPPAVSCLAGELGPEVVVTRDGARVQEAEGGLEVAGGDRKRLLDRLDAVVEGEAGVPDRVPEPLGHPAHIRAAAVVHMRA